MRNIICALYVDKILYWKKPYWPEFSSWGDQLLVLLVVSWRQKLRIQSRMDRDSFRCHDPTWYSLRPQIQCDTRAAICHSYIHLKRSGLHCTHNILLASVFISMTQSCTCYTCTDNIKEYSVYQKLYCFWYSFITI